MIPCLYILLPNKTEATYTRLLHNLVAIEHNLRPETVLMDFECAAKNAFEATFPNTAVKGCLFHLTQSIYRKAQALGLQTDYQENQDVKMAIRMLPALAFVPEEDVVEAFELYASAHDLPDIVQPVVDYFEDTFIGRPLANSTRRSPRYPISMWNVHDRVTSELPRTNNNIEGWHTSLQSHIGAHHPNFWKLLNILKREQGLAEAAIAQIFNGVPAPPQRKKYKDINTRINNLVAQYDNLSISRFLRRIARNLSDCH